MGRILVTMPKGDTRDTFLPKDVISKLETLGPVEFNDMGRQYTPKELGDLLPGVEIVLTGWGTPSFDEEVLSKADSLKTIAYTGGSVANLTPPCVFDKGILVLSGNDIFAESVAESMIAYALASLRDIPKFAAMVQEQGWSGADWYNEGLLGQTVGIVGFGQIARHVVRLLKPFGVTIKVWADFLTEEDEKTYGIKKVSAEEVFTGCKVISLHNSLTPESYHMIDRRLLEMIPDGAVFINTARGKIVDEAALALELKKQRFKAVLDVYEEEPLPMGSPLRGLSNVILIPHMGGPTIDRRKMVTEGLIADIVRAQTGERPLRLEIGREAAARMTQ